jgi:uncharacterized membrane protein
MTTHRIENLADGIFSIAMTLLVLNLALPEVETGLALTTELHTLLFGQTHKFFNYALSFILLAIFWIIQHQQFHFIKRTDHTHLWINIFSLMFVALVPFSTSLTGDYPNETVAKLFFDLNLFILGSLNVLNWTYATKDYRLVDRSLDPRRIAVGNRRDAVIPVVALLAMVLSLIIPKWSSCVYLLIPIMLAHPWFRHKKT